MGPLEVVTMRTASQEKLTLLVLLCSESEGSINPSKHPQMCTQRRSATTQTTPPLSNTAVRTSNVAEVAWFTIVQIAANILTNKQLERQ
jgi:hypothetical protein